MASWGQRRLGLLWLAAKLSLAGGDVDGLACHLHQPTSYDCLARAQSPLTVVVPSHHIVWAIVALDHSPGGCEAPEDWWPTLAPTVLLDH
jgi:hypothetical protein